MVRMKYFLILIKENDNAKKEEKAEKQGGEMMARLYDLKDGHPNYWGKTPPFKIKRKWTAQGIVLVELEDKNGKELSISKDWLIPIKASEAKN